MERVDYLKSFQVDPARIDFGSYFRDVRSNWNTSTRGTFESQGKATNFDLKIVKDRE